MLVCAIVLVSGIRLMYGIVLLLSESHSATRAATFFEFIALNNLSITRTDTSLLVTAKKLQTTIVTRLKTYTTVIMNRIQSLCFFIYGSTFVTSTLNPSTSSVPTARSLISSLIEGMIISDVQ